jgi:mannose-1-phosphate guanylyltransferase
MAGGSGERFWPLSTKERPKQLLPLISDKSMIRETVDRLKGLVDFNDIYVATNTIQVENLKKELPEIPIENIIIEPAFRDTAAAILYGSTYISYRNENPVIAVLASDHSIKDVKEFQKSLMRANELAKNSHKIITLGIKPTYPETGYGYIKVSNNQNLSINNNVLFEEKPSLDKARLFFEDGHYLWNSGMFIFSFKSLLNEFNNHYPDHINVIKKMHDQISKYQGIKLSEMVKVSFEQFSKISIDFAIMEKSNNIICLPTDFGWSDVGSFFSIFQTVKKQENGNALKNVNLFHISSNNNFIISEKEFINVFLYEINNMLIIFKDNKLVILPLDKTQFIKKLKSLYD